MVDGERSFRPDVQGFRGVAVLLVVAYHVRDLVPGGFIGVDVFFVISGFVITGSLLREAERTGTFSLGGFVVRRVKRLLPALSVLLIVVGLVGVVLLSPAGPLQQLGETGRAAALSAANFELYDAGGYFEPRAEANPLLHTWSLSVEEQFYLAFAFATALLARLRNPSRRSVLTCGVLLTVVAAAANFHWSFGGGLGNIVDGERFAFFSPIGRAFEFGAGIVLAAAGASWVLGRRMSNAVGSAGAVMLAVAAIEFDDSTRFPGTAVLLPVIGTVAVLAGGPLSWVGNVLSTRWLGWLGDRSYGLYLWHWPLLVFARLLSDSWAALIAAVLVSIVAADFSFRLIETPIRNRRNLSGRRVVTLAFGCVAVPAALATSAIYAADRGLGIDGAEQLLARTEARDRGCHTDVGEPILPLSECTWVVQNPTGSVMLVGDSHAVSVADMVVSVGNASGRDVAVRTRSLCPFQERRIKRRGCAGYQRDTAAEIAELQPDTVVIVNRAPSYVNSAVGAASVYSIVDEDDEVTIGAAAGLAAWRSGMGSVVDSMPASVRRIIIIETGPEFDVGGGAESVSLLRPDGVARTRTLVEVEERRGATMQIHLELAESDSRVTVIDPVPLLCDDQRCSQRFDGEWVYYDDDHISLAGAERLAGALRLAMESPP